MVHLGESSSAKPVRHHLQVTQLFAQGAYLSQCLCQPFYYDAVSSILVSSASPLLLNKSLLAG